MAKKIAGWLHLWFGLVAGLVVLISLFSASIFVWEKELTRWVYHDETYIANVKPYHISVTTMLHNAQAALKNKGEISYMEMENDPHQAWVFSAYKSSGHKSWYYSSGIEYSYRVFVNPYTGHVTGLVNDKYDWIKNLYLLHICLLLNYDYGHYIVGGATLIILVMVITGIVLWWPKNKAALKQRYWFRWKDGTKWRRKNYDVHNIGGIYTLIIILLLAITGLAWTFDWWENGIYRLMGNDPKKVFKETPLPKQYTYQNPNASDLILSDGMSKIKNWNSLGMNFHEGRTDSAQMIYCFIKYRTGRSGWDETDEYFYNSKTGKQYAQYLEGEKVTAAKWRYSNYAIHTGSIYGWPTKVLASLGTLFCASLPVTGFMIWRGRKKKAKRYPQK